MPDNHEQQIIDSQIAEMKEKEEMLKQQQLEELEKQKQRLQPLKNNTKHGLNTVKSNPVQYKTQGKPISNDNADWEKLISDYKKQFNKEPQNNILGFESRQKATDFFAQEAGKNLKFLSTEIDASGKPTGHHVFSCGDGHLYQGSLAEINNALKNALKHKPDDPSLLEGIKKINQAIINNNGNSIKSQLPKKEDDEPEHSKKNEFKL